jgi:hypothetical protein
MKLLSFINSCDGLYLMILAGKFTSDVIGTKSLGAGEGSDTPPAG